MATATEHSLNSGHLLQLALEVQGSFWKVLSCPDIRKCTQQLCKSEVISGTRTGFALGVLLW